jgi:hypothetical protein
VQAGVVKIFFAEFFGERSAVYGNALKAEGITDLASVVVFLAICVIVGQVPLALALRHREHFVDAVLYRNRVYRRSVIAFRLS